MEYVVVRGMGDVASFQSRVNNLLKEGFKLHGNLCIGVSISGTTIYVQALIKEDKNLTK